MTKNTMLFEDFSFAGQTGTQFTTLGSTGYQYLDWKNADIVVPNGNLGDSIEVYLIASDCSPVAHSGYAYLDGFGSAAVIPGPVVAVGPPIGVPTLGEWSLMTLAGLLAIGAVVVGRRRTA